MPEEKGKDGSPAEDGLSRAGDRLRESAKWLIVSFGALGAAVFTGVSVSDIGKLDFSTPSYRFTIALVGGGLTMAAVAVALARAMQLAGASTTSLRDLTRNTKWYEFALKETRAELADDPALNFWNGSLDRFIDTYNGAYADFIDRVTAYSQDPDQQPDQTDLHKAHYQLQELTSVADRMLASTSFLRLQRSFRYARWLISLALLTAATGAVAFAWAANPPTDVMGNLTPQPRTATFHPDAEALATVNRQAKPGCVVTATDVATVVVLGIDSDKQTVDLLITAPRHECIPLRMTVPSSQVRLPI